MKNRDVVEKILAYHPVLPGYQGCDEWKCGDPEAECTGIVTALVPTMDIIRKTAELGANLLIVHEPIFYTSADKGGWYEDFPNAVYDEKRALLDRCGIAVWRDHDHMHAHQPDGIFTGVLKHLGWLGRERADYSSGGFGHFIVDLPREMTVEELCRHIKSAIGLGLILNQGIGDTIRVSLTGDPVEEIKAARLILRTLGLRKGGIEVISCPTCGRTKIDLIGLANQVESMVCEFPLDIKVAVMGCAVNGPGEAKEADIGIAGGIGEGLLIRKGEIIRKVPEDQLLDVLRQELENWQQ